MKLTMDKVTRRIDDSRVEILNTCGIPTTLIATENVIVEMDGIKQLLSTLSLQETLDEIRRQEEAGAFTFWGDPGSPDALTKYGSIAQVVVTPDFHKSGGIPVGTVIDARNFVIPKAVGNDVCCGMRLLVTDMPVDELTPVLDRFGQGLRRIFFGGERNIPMSPKQREALLKDGLKGLEKTNAEIGIWNYYDGEQEKENLRMTHLNGCLPVTADLSLFEDYIKGSGAADGRDAQIGSIGGGNHFVEVQAIEELIDSKTAFHWGVKRGMVAIMIHSGSVGLGHTVGGYYMDLAQQLFPKGIKHPEHGFYVLPTVGRHANRALEYLAAMNMAANFAFGNRLFLGLMALRALGEAAGRTVGHKLIYDAPHNLIWNDGDRFIHRKGACPALGSHHLTEGDPYEYYGIPVIIPGSMGSASYLLAGAGNDSLLSSACHGAGRSVTRLKARQSKNEERYRLTGESLRVITPIDPDSPEIKGRPDILAQYHSRLMEEAPYAYKPITPIIESVEAAGIARSIARLRPILTIKG
ncbi:MAG: RtcB family protein [Cyanobacteria bacterium]|nr:RtcB family protein [Cyanobacteriota bacterium]